MNLVMASLRKMVGLFECNIEPCSFPLIVFIVNTVIEFNGCHCQLIPRVSPLPFLGAPRKGERETRERGCILVVILQQFETAA